MTKLFAAVVAALTLAAGAAAAPPPPANDGDGGASCSQGSFWQRVTYTGDGHGFSEACYNGWYDIAYF